MRSAEESGGGVGDGGDGDGDEGGSGNKEEPHKKGNKVNQEYGRAGREEFRSNVISAFPKFVLASAALISVGGSYDFFKFYRSMKNGGAEGRWRKLADGDRSGKEGHAGEPTIIYDVRGRVVATLSSEAVKLKDVAPAVW